MHLPRNTRSIHREGVTITRRSHAGVLGSVALLAAAGCALAAIWTGDGRWWQTAALCTLCAVILASAAAGEAKQQKEP